jgi:hypothetical protein
VMQADGARTRHEEGIAPAARSCPLFSGRCWFLGHTRTPEKNGLPGRLHGLISDISSAFSETRLMRMFESGGFVAATTWQAGRQSGAPDVT